MAIASADLQLIISAIDNSGGPLRQAAEGVNQLGAAGGGAAGGLTKLGLEAEGAGRKAQESGGLFRGMGESIAEVAKIAAGFALGGIALSAASGVETLFGSITELGHATHSLQMEIGGSAEQVSGMLAVFERWGVTNEQAAVSLGILSKNITQYNDESQKAQNAATGMSGAVDRLGLTLKDASGASVSANDALLQIADRFKAMPDGVEKTADAMALFGRSGRDMIPVLNQGRAGIQAAMDTAKQYGLVLSQDNVEAVYKFGQAQRDLSEVMKGFAVQVGILVLPALISIVQGVTSMAETFSTTVLPPIRAVVEYISNNFGPYIAAGVALAGDAFNALAGVVSGALGSVLSIVVSVGQAIADALSWLNPFAEHSPSLVSQVADGISSIKDSYSGVTAISGPLAEAGASVQDFADKGKTALKDLVTGTKEQLASVTDALKDAQTSLTNWGKTPIEGTKAFQDQLDAIDTKSNQVRLAIDQIKLGHDITPQLEALNAQLKEVQLQTVPKGGGAAHTAAVKGLEEQINLLKTSGAQGDIKGLEDQLKNLGLQADAVKLTEKLQLDPLRAQLKEIANPALAEKPFKDIAAGLTAAREQINILTPEQTKLNDILKAQQAALSDIGAAAHVAAAGHKALGGAAANIASPFKDANQAITTAKETISDWGAKVSDARTHIETFTGGIVTAVTSFPGVTAFFTGLKGAIGDLGDFIKGHGLNFGDLFANLGGAGAGLGTIAGTLGSGLLDMLKKVWGSIDWPSVWKAAGDLANGILATGGDLLGKVVTWLQGVWGSIHWADVWSKAVDIGGGIVTAAGNILGKVEDWLKTTWASIHWIDIWAKAQDIGNGILVAGATLLKTVEDWLKTTWATIHWDAIWKVVTTFVTEAANWVKGLNFAPVIDAIIAKMKDATASASFQPFAQAYMDRTQQSIADAQPQSGPIHQTLDKLILAIAAAVPNEKFAPVSDAIATAIAAAFSISMPKQSGSFSASTILSLITGINNVYQGIDKTVNNLGAALVEGIHKGIALSIPNFLNDQREPLLLAILGMITGINWQSVRDAINKGITGAVPTAPSGGTGIGPQGGPSFAGSGVTPDGYLGTAKNNTPVVTNNTPVTITQTFTGNPNPSDVGGATSGAVTQALRAAGLH